MALNCWIALRAGVMGRIPGLRRFALKGKGFDIHAGRPAGEMVAGQGALLFKAAKVAVGEDAVRQAAK